MSEVRLGDLLERGLERAVGCAFEHGQITAEIYLGESLEDLEEHRAILAGVLQDVDHLKKVAELEREFAAA